MYEDFYISLIMTLFSATYVIFIVFTLQLKKRKQDEGKKKFFKALNEGLKVGSIISLEDIVNIYKGATGLSSEDLQYRYGLSKNLREFLVELTSKNKNIFGEVLDDNQVRQWSQKITEFIKNNEKTSPYADLPSAERNILTDLSLYAENNDVNSTKRKLSELVGLIQGRNDELIRISKINRWSVPISVIGLILTIIFGILAMS